MKRAGLRAAAIAMAAMLSWGVSEVRGQEAEIAEGAPTVEPGDQVAAFMQRLGLKRLQAEDLEQRLMASTGQARVGLAERLGRLYVMLLSEATDPADRRNWEDRSRELLRLVPETDSFELRLGLTKTLHLQATEAVERHRLRMATAEEVAESERVLRSIAPQLSEIAQKVNRRIQNMEAMEEKGDTSEKLSEELAIARRVRSQAFYYLGWTQYYIAMLTNSDEAASDALKSFGWLLNSPDGRLPALERLQRGNLKYEHIARAAAGTALATALRGNHVVGVAWLEAIEETEGISEGLQANLPTWRIAVLASAKRWSDLERYVRLVRQSDRTGGGENVKPLGVISARLLAVSALEADKTVAAQFADPLAAIAMGDLVSGGHIAHVLDLVQRYGTAPLGEKGFIVNYVRGIEQYEKARTAHKAKSPKGTGSAEAGVSADEPTTDPDAVAAYRMAATLLRGAIEESDAEGFKAERAKASLLWGFALFYSSDLESAADRFMATVELASTGAQSEEAMWLAVLALDHAVEKGNKSLEKRRDETAAIFLQTHADSPHAPKLLLRRAMAGALDPEEAVRILMGVDKDSPMYGAARQHAARLLYQQFRAARGTDREFAAMRFVGVAEEALNHDRRVAMDPESADAANAATRVIARVRQILDALLSGQNVDPARAQTAIDILTNVAESHKIDISEYQHELTYRRMQIAAAKGDFAGASQLSNELQANGGQFATAADQMMYKRAVARKQQDTDVAAANRDIVLYGERLIERMVADGGAMKDNVVLSLHQVVAEAATELWVSQQDGAAREVAIRLDTRLLESQPRNQAALRRLAGNAESAGGTQRALECWRVLLSGLDSGTREWFEARYESIRLLAPLDAARAREVMRQHVLLYPEYGPEPWGGKLRKIDEELGKQSASPPSSPAPSTPPTPAPSGPGGGP